jgi:hypothetical protein
MVRDCRSGRVQGLVFDDLVPVVAADPNRADIALFVGFVGCRPGVRVPASVARWLRGQGWITGQNANPEVVWLNDAPIPIDSWQVFDLLYAWDDRSLGTTALGVADASGGTTLLGAAVRSFFAQGGRKCYVVRVGDPWPLTTDQSNRLGEIGKLIPGYVPNTATSPRAVDVSPVDPKTWHGVGHLFGLPDVSILCLPDLADAVASDRLPPEPATLPAPPRPRFVECSEGDVPTFEQAAFTRYRAPRCDLRGYRAWTMALAALADLLEGSRREVQLVEAVPIPEPGSAAERSLLPLLSMLAEDGVAKVPGSRANGLASAFVQLVFPWVRTAGSANLPEQLENPAGVLAGVLAGNALGRGAFHSAAGLGLADVTGVFPVVGPGQLMTEIDDPDLGQAGARGTHTLLERVSIVGPTPDGLQVLSDVTTSLDETYRPASVNRLVSIIVRAARLLGEEIAFESSGEPLWAQLRNSLNSLLLGLLQDGALHGTSPEQAFSVRCDRSTMTQNDLDGGRVVAEIQFDAAAPIEQITVVLALNEGGQVSLLAADDSAGVGAPMLRAGGANGRHP